VSERLERAASKGLLASSLAATGATIGGLPGAVIGGITGLIVGDGETVFTIDMIAIPAFQAYMLDGTPSQIVYIKAGETLLPTGGNVRDVQEVLDAPPSNRKPRKKLNAYQRFSKRFDFRKKRKNENQRVYFSARSKALSKAWAKHKNQRLAGRILGGKK